MGTFNTTDSIEQILDKMNKSDGNTETVHAGPCFLNYKLQELLLKQQEDSQKKLLDSQETLLKSQNEYNKKQLCWTKLLVIGTWALVLATVYLAWE